MNDLTNQTSQGTGKQAAQGLVERFQALPTPAKIGLLAVVLLFVVLLLGRGGENGQPAPAPDASNAGTSANLRQLQMQEAAQQAGVDGNEPFQALEQERPTLQKQFVEQQQLALNELRQEVRDQLAAGQNNLSTLEQSITQQTRQMSQMLESFDAQMKSMQEANRRAVEEINRLATQAQQRNENDLAPQAYKQGSAPRRVEREITQNQLSPAAGGFNTSPDQALLNPLVRESRRLNLDPDLDTLGTSGTAGLVKIEPNPFLPPLGFIRGTLLNGFDAMAGGGRATPALVRLSGVYKTAMNSTVNLNGCLALVEFEGDISTERAVGKPSRMTCVYPDRGAVTYDITGYVVDKKDGIVGVPGVFYEGDPGRIASAMMADFIAGVAAVIESNQNTFTVNADGTSQKTLTGNQVQAEIAGGANKAMGSLRDYLFERANRVMPFIRIDNTRDIHLVLLSGTELRDEGSAWTLLFDGLQKDAMERASVNRQSNNNTQAQR